MATDPNAVNNHKCWACGEPLKAGQAFCRECKNWQNWRKHTSFSATILSLLIALFAVLGTVIPQISSFLSKEVVLVEFSGESRFVQSSSDLQLSVWMKNVGSTDVTLIKNPLCSTDQRIEPIYSWQVHAASLTHTGIGEVTLLEFKALGAAVKEDFRKVSKSDIFCSFTVLGKTTGKRIQLHFTNGVLARQSVGEEFKIGSIPTAE